MDSEQFGLAKPGETLTGYLGCEKTMHLAWFPDYVDQFSTVMNNISLRWEKCKFVSSAKNMIPQEHGVYCFSILLGEPFPKDIHLILYIGKAAPGYLSERFNSYFQEKNSAHGRKKIIYMLEKYQNDLFFWWSTLPRIYVDTVEEHLLMCCKPPCNEIIPSRERLWGKAFS